METAAQKAGGRPLLKVKLGAPGDPERIAAVRRGAPRSTLIADANEGWDEASLEANFAACQAAGVKLIEQPLPAGKDGTLGCVSAPARRGIPVCADESLHTSADLSSIAQLYQAVNIKLDKAGGLTAALALLTEARNRGLAIMAGCMVAHLACDGARSSSRSQRGLRRFRRPPAARPRPRTWPRLRGQRDPALRPGTLGLTALHAPNAPATAYTLTYWLFPFSIRIYSVTKTKLVSHAIFFEQHRILYWQSPVTFLLVS